VVIFNLQSREYIFSDTQYNKPVHDINGCVVFTNVKKQPFYVEWWLFAQGSKLLALLIPCSESTAPFLAPLPGPYCHLFPHSHPHMRTVTTPDDYNMLKSSSVGHKVSVAV
jgi:hypothetical protein